MTQKARIEALIWFLVLCAWTTCWREHNFLKWLSSESTNKCTRTHQYNTYESKSWVPCCKPIPGCVRSVHVNYSIVPLRYDCNFKSITFNNILMTNTIVTSYERVMTSQIASNSTVCSISWGLYQRKYQSSVLLGLCGENPSVIGSRITKV